MKTIILKKNAQIKFKKAKNIEIDDNTKKSGEKSGEKSYFGKDAHQNSKKKREWLMKDCCLKR